MYEFVTAEIQTNEVSISRVYPCINYLRKGLQNSGTLKYTKELRADLLESLNRRFKCIEEDEVFVFSTFLDPKFGNKSYDTDFRVLVIIKNTIKQKR
jgi:hypothetical protein